MPRVMIVEDEQVLAKNLRAKLAAHDFDVSVVHSGEDALRQFPRQLPDVVLLDIRLPGVDGLTLLPKLKAEATSTSFVVMTAHGNERVAVDAMKAGAFEYLTKPIDLDELLMVVNRAIEHQQLADNMSFLRSQEEQVSGVDRIVGDSPAIRGVKETIQRLTRSGAIALPDAPTVLITGETGCGKDLVARAVHYEGPRRSKPFIHVNCTALPATLFESELFGHVAGAFTSAQKAKRGLFEVAQGGTIFLDEIGHLEPEMQAKLLLAIEQREIRPVGGTDNRSVNVHIIAATNRDLGEAVAAGEFRRDLYHRLRVVEIRIPSLRSRREDIPLLAQHFLAAHCRKFGVSQKSLDASAMRAFERHEWRGNVRELSHVLESAVLRVEGPAIREQDVLLEQEQDAAPGALQLTLSNGRTINVDLSGGTTTLDEIEYAILSSAFEHWGRNLSRAARALGITREALRYRLNKLPQTVNRATVAS